MFLEFEVLGALTRRPLSQLEDGYTFLFTQLPVYMVIISPNARIG